MADDPVEEGTAEPEEVGAEQPGSPGSVARHGEAQTFFQKQRLEL